MTSLVQLLAGLTGMLVLWGIAWLLWPDDDLGQPRPSCARAPERSDDAEPADQAATRSATLPAAEVDEATEIIAADPGIELADEPAPLVERDWSARSDVPAFGRKRVLDDTLLERRSTAPFMRAVGSAARDEDAPGAELQEQETRPFDRAHLLGAGRAGAQRAGRGKAG